MSRCTLTTRVVCDPTGFVKIHTKKGKDVILGATIVAPDAGNLISEITVAMKAGMGLGALAAVIHPYPTQARRLTRFCQGISRAYWHDDCARKGRSLVDTPILRSDQRAVAFMSHGGTAVQSKPDVCNVQAEAIRQTGDMYARTKLTPFVKRLFVKLLKWRRS